MIQTYWKNWSQSEYLVESIPSTLVFQSLSYSSFCIYSSFSFLSCFWTGFTCPSSFALLVIKPDHKLKTIFFSNSRVAGTAGAVVTCPLEVVKTRLQSSKGVGVPPPGPPPSDNATSTRKVCSKIPKHQVQIFCRDFSQFLNNHVNLR